MTKLIFSCTLSLGMFFISGDDLLQRRALMSALTTKQVIIDSLAADLVEIHQAAPLRTPEEVITHVRPQVIEYVRNHARLLFNFDAYCTQVRTAYLTYLAQKTEEEFFNTCDDIDMLYDTTNKSCFIATRLTQYLIKEENDPLVRVVSRMLNNQKWSKLQSDSNYMHEYANLAAYIDDTPLT